MSSDFQTTTYGKWILAGEHAVIRGHGALVFPVHNKKLTLLTGNPALNSVPITKVKVAQICIYCSGVSLSKG